MEKFYRDLILHMGQFYVKTLKKLSSESGLISLLCNALFNHVEMDNLYMT